MNPPDLGRRIDVIEPLKLVWKLKEEETFYQELLVTQKPTYSVQGVPVAAFLQYRIVSRFKVTKRNDDGSLIVEQIFGLPGIGRYFVQAALNRDYTLVMGVTIFYAALIITLNLVVDLLYGVLDPRVRFK